MCKADKGKPYLYSRFKYDVRYNKPKTVKKAFKRILGELGLPKIKLIIRKEPFCKSKKKRLKGSVGIFDTGKKGKPYIVLWKEGWNDETIKHELIHYVQFLVDGERIFSTSNDDDDLFEKEAYVAQGLPIEELKQYVKFRLEYKEFN